MKLQITDHLDGAISKALESGEYATPEDFMSALGHAVSDEASRNRIREAWLRASIRYSDAQGGGRPHKDVFADIYEHIEYISEQK